MIAEEEAKGIVVQLGTAMMNDDKELREVIYKELDPDSLRRVIRWSMRIQIHFFYQLCSLFGLDPKEAWSKIAMDIYNDNS